MQIADSDARDAIKWIEAHWNGEPLCPVCNNNNWVLGRTILEMRPFLKGKLSTSGFIYPAVVFTCNVCGNTLFFNAIRLGIIKFPPPKEVDRVVTSPTEVAPPKEKEGDDNG